MRKLHRLFYSALILLLLVPQVEPASISRAQTKQQNHGGKIETSYDGFSHETVMSLQKMRVSCEGMKNTFKDACVSMMVSLHCRGVQAYYVNHVTLHLMFETRAWDQRHPIDQRQLSVVVNNETLRLGQMKLISQTTSESMTETLGITFPYDSFKKITEAQFVEVQVGSSRFMLRNKNIEALRDLNSRVVNAVKPAESD
jgi:hypothetical protein